MLIATKLISLILNSTFILGSSLWWPNWHLHLAKRHLKPNCQLYLSSQSESVHFSLSSLLPPGVYHHHLSPVLQQWSPNRFSASIFVPYYPFSTQHLELYFKNVNQISCLPSFPPYSYYQAQGGLASACSKPLYMLCFLCIPCYCSYSQLAAPLSSLPRVACCEDFTLVMSSTANALPLGPDTDCFFVTVFDFFVSSVEKGRHFLCYPILIFVIACYHSLITFLLVTLSVYCPPPPEREIFILFTTVSLLPGT